MSGENYYQVIVVGGGHAGCEAALACARRGIRTLLLTGNIDQIGAMSCNPAIGGLGKGHLVREIDALGGEMGKNIDETGIQFRRLNSTKGPAVQGTRAQADKYLYRDRMRFVLQRQNYLTIKQGIVKSLLVRNRKIEGLQLTGGDRFDAMAVILTTGTFLRGICHVGLKSFAGGRAGDDAANDLSRSLEDACGLELLRLKTGTVPRIDGKTINYEGLEEQKGDDPLPLFSFTRTTRRQEQVSCYITYTNPRTHEIIRGDLDKSPLFQGVIKGTGPRYCPSIEDKIVRFADKDRHQIFLEPEGLQTCEVYPNGLSTSLPLETQMKFIRSIPGMEHAEITRPGYAVEYDAINPIQLKPNLETKNVAGLFFAGQINGTSGYEEAAAQGIYAGINAGQFVQERDHFCLSRDRAYLGVLVDDLVTKGVGGEPYRMFTSRAEYRMALREDNADFRLRDLGRELGLVPDKDYGEYLDKKNAFAKLKDYCKNQRLPDQIEVFCVATGTANKKPPSPLTIEQWIRRPEVTSKYVEEKAECLFPNIDATPASLSVLVSDIKYKGYIDRYDREIAKMADYDRIKIPPKIDYLKLHSLSTEVCQKLIRHKPETLGQALRLPGITPAAIAQLHIFIASRKIISE